MGALNGFFNALPIAGTVGAAYAPVAFLTKVVGIVNTVVRTIARYKAHGVSDQFSG